MLNAVGRHASYSANSPNRRNNFLHVESKCACLALSKLSPQKVIDCWRVTSALGNQGILTGPSALTHKEEWPHTLAVDSCKDTDKI